MKLGILMDPLESLNLAKDSTLAMVKAAEKMGWDCNYFLSSDLFCRDGRAFANLTKLKIRDFTSQNWAITENIGEQALGSLDIILMRKDPPFDMEYIYATYTLELAERESVLVANKPQSLRDANEKFYTLQFPQCCPTTLISKEISKLRAFWNEHTNVIFKPLDSMGGQGVFHINQDGENLSVILELLTKNQSIHIMAQEYIPAIKTKGDKRILLINGEPVPFALARIPAKGELRGNLAAGAKGEVVAITDKDRWICKEIGPSLRAKGLYFVGIDVIGDYLTEINVTSPTCIRQIEKETNLDIAGDYLRFLESVKLGKRP